MKLQKTLLLMAASVLAVAACQTTEESWSKPQLISEEESAYEVYWPEAMTQTEIRRYRVTQSYSDAYEERWRWPTGAARAHHTPRGTYIRDVSSNDPKSLVTHSAFWKKLSPSGVTVDETDIQRDTNVLGNFFYALSDKNTSGKLCFVYFQAVKAASPPGYETVVGGADDLLAAVDCQPHGAVSRDDYVENMVALFKSLRLQYPH